MQSLRMEYESDPVKYRGIKKTLSRVLTGGSMPPPELIDWYRKTLSADVTQIWGMTEMLSHCVCFVILTVYSL